MNELDKKAKKILFATFWKNGWIDAACIHTSAADFTYAKARGLMFDPLSISHDALMRRLIDLRQSMPVDKAAKAFLCSLSTRRVDWRSSLASWHLACGLTPHEYVEHVRLIGHSYEDGRAIPHESRECAICGGQENYRDEDLNVLNFERIRWGGVRHGSLIYTLLDLEQLAKAELPEPSPADLAIFGDILDIIETSAPMDAPGALRTRLRDALPSNKDELSVLIEILAFCGVLVAKSPDRPGLGGRHDWAVVADWRGEDRYDQNRVAEIFGAFR